MRFSILVLCAGALCAQNTADLFNKPPAKVDKALRARIGEFYEDHVKQEFRKAEALVAEDTKNFFYSQNKPAYLSFDISRIEYSDNFTKAKATVVCEQYIMMPGFADKPMKVPVPSTWKLVKGKWYWYVDQSAFRHTPFGDMKPAPPAAAGSVSPAPSLPASIPDSPEAAAALFLNKVRTDKSSVNLKPGQTEEVTFTNTASGPMTLTIPVPLKGVETTFDPAEMKTGEKAKLVLRAGEGAKSGVLKVKVAQTGETIPIQVAIQ
jgi:hypothetical protein